MSETECKKNHVAKWCISLSAGRSVLTFRGRKYHGDQNDQQNHSWRIKVGNFHVRDGPEIGNKYFGAVCRQF